MFGWVDWAPASPRSHTKFELLANFKFLNHVHARVFQSMRNVAVHTPSIMLALSNFVAGFG